MTEVSLRALEKAYSRVPALKAISLDVGHGEFVSLLGPSGCGKSTTLKCIAGFEEPSGGQICFDGRDISRRLPEERDIGMVFQSYALFPHLTVAQNLAFGLEMRRRPKPEIAARVARAMEMVQLTPYAGRYPKALSGGQQQRVALARALVIEPAILLLDEPLANLDATLRDEMRGFIRDLQRRVGITTLYVTHDQQEAMSMSDRVVVMFDGEIAQVATPEEVYDRPTSERVARFVGNANILDLPVTVQAGAAALRLPGGACLPLPETPETPEQAGPALRVMARPEQIALTEPGRGDLAGRVTRRAFNGGHLDYSIDTDCGLLMVQVPATQRLEEGAAVGLRFDPGRLWPLGPGRAAAAQADPAQPEAAEAPLRGSGAA